MRVYKRKGSESYQAEWYEDGERRQRSTLCRDRAAAIEVAKRWEREAADPDGARARNATVKDALELLVSQRLELASAGKRSSETADYYRRKCGVLQRELGAETKLRRVRSERMAAYVTKRRSDWADDAKTRHIEDSTIFKEVATFGAALRLAKKRNLWRGDVDAVLPSIAELSPSYVPRTRWLTWDELQSLFPKLLPDQAARIAFAVAVGAERGATDRAERADLQKDADEVLVRGTKRPSRWRRVPIVAPWQSELLQYVLDHAEGTAGMLFGPWHNLWRDLRDACDGAEIPHCSLNDLRRTFGHWWRAAGASPANIGMAMGHVDSKMADRVYARLTPGELAKRLAAETVTLMSQPARVQVDSVDESGNGESEKEPVSSNGSCRRQESNLRPWDYDSTRRLLPAPKNKRNRDSERRPVTLMYRGKR